MATAREQALQSLRDMGYSQGQINSAIEQVKSQQSQWQTASQIKSNIQNNSSTYFWGWAMYGSWSSSSSSSSSNSWGSTGGISSNTNAEDKYGDASWNSTWAWPMDFTGMDWKIDEWWLKFWANVSGEKAWYLTDRNNSIAAHLNSKWIYDEEGIANWLNQFKDFYNASKIEKDNTIRAIKERLSAITNWATGNGLTNKETDTWVTGVEWWSLNEKKWELWAKTWQYYDSDGNYYNIYWYDEMSPEYQAKVDGMTEEQKKMVSNLWAAGMQDVAKYYLDQTRVGDQITAQQDIKKQLHDIDMEEFAIQTGQTLRNAEESYNNLKQNWQYLGNLWMPWVSSTKIQAIGDCISEAKTQLNELNKLLDLQKSAKDTEWKGQVLNYTQQMQNIAYDLKWKVWDEITWLLSKYTTAELEGKLDTIDGITAFKKDLLDELDKNLSGITSASLWQMQYINQEYQKIADKAYEYAQNANKVNADMSAVKWYYVDDNWNPILDNYGQVIKTQWTDWMEPVFDKETGKLITFTYDENGNRTANVEQLWDSSAWVTPNWVLSGTSWLWTGIAKMRTERNNNPTAMITDVAKSLWWVEGVDYVVWDSWKNNEWKTYYTAKLLWDPIDTTIKLLDNAAKTWKWAFYTAGWKQRWTHTAMTDDAWLKLSNDQKKQVVLNMLQREWGNINNMSYYVEQSQGNAWVWQAWNKYNQALVDLFNKDSLTAEDKKTITEWADKWWFWMTMAQFWDAKEEYLAQQAWTSDKLNALNRMRDAIWYMLVNYPGEAWSIAAASERWQIWQKIGNSVFGSWDSSSSWWDFMSEYNYLRDNLTMQHFLELKEWGATFGAMSNAEWDIISKAASNLNVKTQSKAKFEQTLVKIYNELGDDLVWKLSKKDIINLYSQPTGQEEVSQGTQVFQSQGNAWGSSMWWGRIFK